MKGLHEMNSTELQALFAANPNMLGGGGQQQFPGMGGANASMSQSDPLAAVNAARANQAMMNPYLLQQQADGQQKALLQQQLAALGSFNGSGGSSQQDNINLALMLQQRQMQGQFQGFPGFSGQGAGAGLGNLAALFGAGGMQGMPSNGSGFPGMGNGQMDQFNMANMFQSQQTMANTELQNAQLAALGAAGSLPLPPDRRRKGRTGTFPQKLHQMLSDLEAQDGGADIASFLSHGRAFAIHKPRDFVKTVMPKYFRMSRFSSFQRQLNLYDFQRITEGPDKGKRYTVRLID
jgi:hypothetical protein